MMGMLTLIVVHCAGEMLVSLSAPLPPPAAEPSTQRAIGADGRVVSTATIDKHDESTQTPSRWTEAATTSYTLT